MDEVLQHGCSLWLVGHCGLDRDLVRQKSYRLVVEIVDAGECADVLFAVGIGILQKSLSLPRKRAPYGHALQQLTAMQQNICMSFRGILDRLIGAGYLERLGVREVKLTRPGSVFS